VVSKGTFYGVVITLVALLLISSALTVVYYNDYQQGASQNQKYVQELNTALAHYRSLSSSFNSSLSDYGTTLNLLATAVANLNTSTPAYRNASLALSSLWSSFEKLSSSGGHRALVYGVHMLVNFGSGTRRWYNDTATQPGWNGYVVTLVVLNGNVQATWYPLYGEHLVTGIGGVSQSTTKSWFLWSFTGGKWASSQTGADQLHINNGTSFAWALCSYDANFNPTCTP
jgi:type II secretory pathway pseudopilin PulG